MRIVIVVKSNDPLVLSQEEMEQKIRLFLIRQAAQLKGVKVFLKESLDTLYQPYIALFKVEFITGGCFIFEAKGDNLEIAFRNGLSRLRRSLEIEMRRRWISFNPDIMNKPPKKLIRRIEQPYSLTDSFKWV